MGSGGRQFIDRSEEKMIQDFVQNETETMVFIPLNGLAPQY